MAGSEIDKLKTFYYNPFSDSATLHLINKDNGVSVCGKRLGSWEASGNWKDIFKDKKTYEDFKRKFKIAGDIHFCRSCKRAVGDLQPIFDIKVRELMGDDEQEKVKKIKEPSKKLYDIHNDFIGWCVDAFELMTSYVTLHPCKDCGGPVADGHCCRWCSSDDPGSQDENEIWNFGGDLEEEINKLRGKMPKETPPPPQPPVPAHVAHMKKVLDGIYSLLMFKNAKYGESWRASPIAQPPHAVRSLFSPINEKYMRLKHLVWDGNETEDFPLTWETLRDIIGYCVLSMCLVEEQATDDDQKKIEKLKWEL